MRSRGTTTPSVRIRLSREARRAQLLELGVRMLAGRRLDELSTDDLAAAAGISSGLLFHYFPTKHEFHVAVARAAAGHLRARVLRADPAADPATRVRTSLEAYVDHVAEHHGAYVWLVRGAGGGDPDMSAVYTETRTAFTDFIVEAVGAVQGPVTPALALAVRGWQAFVEEVVLVWMEGHDLTRAELLDMLERSFYRLLGLG
jgi:AcrR family transcriptional regulator